MELFHLGLIRAVALEKVVGSSPVGHPPVIRMTIIVLQQLSTLVMVERRFGGSWRRPSTTSDNQRSVDWLGGWPEAAILYLVSEKASFVSRGSWSLLRAKRKARARFALPFGSVGEVEG